MELILTRDELALYAGWALLGMAVLQAIDIYVSRATESPWRGVRSTVLFGGMGTGLVFGVTWAGWMGLVFGLTSLGEARRLSRTRSVRPELFGALGWFAMGAAVLVGNEFAPWLAWAFVAVASLCAGASLAESWRRRRRDQIGAGRVETHAAQRTGAS